MATLDQITSPCDHAADGCPACNLEALRVQGANAFKAYADALVAAAIARGASERDIAALQGFLAGVQIIFEKPDAN